MTAKKLLTAFGIVPPPFLEGAPDEAYYRLLAMSMSREISKRLKLPEYNTIDDAVGLLKKSKNIMVLTGAGVCTPEHAVRRFASALTCRHLDIHEFRNSRFPVKGCGTVREATVSWIE